MTSERTRFFLLALAVLAVTPSLAATQQDRAGAAITGRVTDAHSDQPMAGATVSIEGTLLAASVDSSGNYRISNVSPGPHVLRAQRIGFAPTRINVVVPTSGTLRQNISMARHAIELQGVQVIADPASRARGELGTASVIGQEAIRNQMASSLAGVLELVPGVVLQPPGLDGVQQISLRASPISGGDQSAAGNPSAQQLSSFGTLIVLDGVPLSNNANLQSLGARADLGFSSAAGGGIDLRRIPATVIERVEVIRGVPSARYGDLTHGTIIVDTRAGAVSPEFALRFDARTREASIVGGRALGPRNTATLNFDVAKTRTRLGTSSDEATRISGQLAHRALLGARSTDGSDSARLVLDTRADFYALRDEHPEVPTFPGRESASKDAGVRISERLRLRLGSESRLEITAAFDRTTQRSFARRDLLRAPIPITSAVEPGRAVGGYLAGVYNARADVSGDPAQFYSRVELSGPRRFLGLTHGLRLGGEFRREGNTGEGYQFDMTKPPQVTFNGVRGFDRPRDFRDIPALATTALYFDDRISAAFGSVSLNVQAGLRLDALHSGTSWFSGARDRVLQPRLSVELAPASWLRLRAGAGRLAKMPALGQLYPSPQYFDVINVNFFANEPSERLAVLTTFIFDPTNDSLEYSVADKKEAGFELMLGRSGAHLEFVAFSDRLSNAVGMLPEATFVLREHFDLTNTAPGSGRPPQLVEPASSVDSVPIIIERMANNISEKSRGMELTATLPEIPALRTRVSVQGSYVKSRLEKEGIEFAQSFPQFQISTNQPRSPYYEGLTRTGERMLLTTRVIHHQPAIGLVLTGTVQHTLRETRQDVGAVDTLAFAGYITRGGSLVPVPEADRTRPEYFDIRLPRRGTLINAMETPSDWLFSFQVMKTLPLDGRLSFYAFNAFDKIGRFGRADQRSLLYPSSRFGVEVTMPLGGLISWR